MFNRYLRLFYVLIFAYFVSMMLVMGNGHSFLGRYLSSFFIPVANTIGLNTTWNFFSPDPAHVMYMKYTLIMNDDANTIIEKYYPDDHNIKEEFALDKRRHSYAMHFLAFQPERIAQYFIPWKCREFSNARRIEVKILVDRTPALDEVLAASHLNYENLVQSEQVSEALYECSND